jgi:mannose-6-phosphate isomerase-like protein (cupin superfamily)
MRLTPIAAALALAVPAAALVLAVPAAAQARRWAAPPDPFIYKSASEIDAAVSKPDSGHAYGTLVVNDHEDYFIEFLKRLDHGNMVERHPHSIDQVTIVAGTGVLTYGGTVQGGTTAPNGELRGGTQVGAKTQGLKPGDFVLIPAGMAHKFDAAPGKSLTYVVAKARQ